MSPARQRLDRVLVERGLASSRPQAAELVERGLVLVGGALAEKPARLVAPSDPVELQTGPPPFVSRGGEKLRSALDRFAIDVRGARVLDAGASTGGFTDCLLQAGAGRVYAVDVGHGQLHEQLRSDARVVSLERNDVRSVGLDRLEGSPVDAAVVDLSFISLTSVLGPILADLTVPGGPVVLLVKPQFEAGRRLASKGRGVVRDPVAHRDVLARVAAALSQAGGRVVDAMPSPVRGRSGNLEFLLWIQDAHANEPGGSGRRDPAETARLLDAVVAEAHGARQDGAPWR